jgi:hypothetical protein
MTRGALLKQHLSALGKKGAKARRKKYGKGIYTEMTRKRWQSAPLSYPKASRLHKPDGLLQ